MNTAVCTAVVNSTGIPVIAVQKIMNAAICTAVVNSTGIPVIAVQRLMKAAIWAMIIPGTWVAIAAVHQCRVSFSSPDSHIHNGVEAPNSSRHVDISVHSITIP
jgi:hypothetical protein